MTTISEVRFTPVVDPSESPGLRGFVRFVLNGCLVVDGVAVRVTRAGKLALSYPRRRDRREIEHRIIRPLNDQVRREIEAQVFRVLGDVS